MKENKINILVWFLFAFVGAMLFMIGVFVMNNNFNYENKIDTIGTITEISSYKDRDGEEENEVYVSYTIAGKKYESKLNGYSSNFYEGKEIEIYYDKDNPNKIGMKSLDKLFVIIPSIGAIFCVMGIGGIIISLKRSKDIRYLKENGTVIYANYVKTVANTLYAINGRNPYNIICEWENQIDGEKYVFKSENVWENPEDIIRQRNIKQFSVYINSQDLSKYAVDIDVLKEEK